MLFLEWKSVDIITIIGSDVLEAGKENAAYFSYPLFSIYRIYCQIILYLLASTAVGFAGSDRIQSPDAPWKTIKTANYHIYYPANPKGDFEAFAMEVASKIEGIHARVAEWVGFEAKGPVSVVIMDPIMEANGFTGPFINRPIVVLYKTPPDPDDIKLGHYDNWVNVLLSHELAHIHHIMRPRNGETPLRTATATGPIRNAPRLILEGYATLIEGRVTGMGRPHSAYRAAVIRQWALQGKLPDYGAASKSGGFWGGSMAYLIGSAYLEWLERSNPNEPDILKKFWKQLTSKNKRSYAASFQATFGMKPKDSYDRWRAEVTHDAIALERNAKDKGLIREGVLITRVDGEITDLALSPDGSKLMARVLTSQNPGIRVWDLVAPPEPDKKNMNPKPKKPDPSKVVDRPPEFIAPKLLVTIGKINDALPRHAWWTGNNQITFEVRFPNSENILEPSFRVMDLETKKIKPAAAPAIAKTSEYTWKDIDGTWNIVKMLPNDREQQLTRTLSAAWQPSITPDGKFLYYVQLSATGCEIRKLDLALPELDELRIIIPDNLLVQDTVLSPPDTISLLPPPSDAVITAADYSVWDSHKTGQRRAYSLSPSSKSIQFGWGGGDILNRFGWYAIGSYGAAREPWGAAFDIAYRGWRFSPSLHAFSSLEKPSRQSIAPVYGLDRERYGAEFALTLLQGGMSPIIFKPFAAWEYVKNTDSGIENVNRYLTGAMADFAVQRSRGNWGIGLNASFQGAFGRSAETALKTELETDIYIGSSANWELARFKAALSLKTPLGSFNLSAEEGRIYGDYGVLDAFHLGGQNTDIVPDSLNLNRVQQPALPGYASIGDKMRKLRAEYGSGIYFYFESAAVWSSNENGIDCLRVAGVELQLDKLLDDSARMILRYLPLYSVGIHRPLDGVMKDRTVFTVNVRIKN